MNNYCELEECLALKELGFKGRVFHHFEDGVEKLYLVNKLGWDFNSSFSDCCSRPTYEEAIDFLESKFDIWGHVEMYMSGSDEFDYIFRITWLPKEHEDEKRRGGFLKHYDSDIRGHNWWRDKTEAKKELLKRMIKIIKNENKRS